jgi:hypothetical protein
LYDFKCFLWPLDNTDTFRVIKNLFCSDAYEVVRVFYAVEIKMIEIIWIALIVGIRWGSDNGFWISEKTSDECLGKCRFPSSQLSYKKNPISWYEIKEDFW